MGLFWKRKKDENERPSHWPPSILPTTITPIAQPPAAELPAALDVEPATEAPAALESAPAVETPVVPPPAAEPPPLRKVDMNFTFGGYIVREPTPEEIEAERRTLYGRLKTAVTSTRHTLVDRIDLLVRGKKVIDAELLDGLEEILIGADIGVQTALDIIETARKKVARNELSNPEELRRLIREELLACSSRRSRSRRAR
jgi:fused signal recognition particle receptor